MPCPAQILGTKYILKPKAMGTTAWYCCTVLLQVQRYEGGFTLFGPHTLDAYIQVRCKNLKLHFMLNRMVSSENCWPTVHGGMD